MLALPRLEDCFLCKLRDSCDQVVWGTCGGERGGIAVVGDFPGSEEDLMGRPFMSRGGLVVRKLLTAAGIDPDTSLLTYAVKCMPFQDPKAGQIEACRPHLWAELRAAAPRAVIALGTLPSSVLLGRKSLKMGEVAGKFFRMGNCVIAPWWGEGKILNGGKQSDNDTVAFFRKVKGITDEAR